LSDLTIAAFDSARARQRHRTRTWDRRLVVRACDPCRSVSAPGLARRTARRARGPRRARTRGPLCVREDHPSGPQLAIFPSVLCRSGWRDARVDRPADPTATGCEAGERPWRCRRTQWSPLSRTAALAPGRTRSSAPAPTGPAQRAPVVAKPVARPTV